MDLEKIFVFFGWFILCCLVCSFIGLLIYGIVFGVLFLLQYNIFIGVGAMIGIVALGMTIEIMKEY